MALTKEDISIQGTGGYGTLSYTPEPGKNIEGTAGDIAAETATSGIVSSDASAELAGQAPNIVVPVNQSSDSDDSGLTVSSGNGITSEVDLNDIINKDRLIGIGLAQVNPVLGLAYNAYKYFDNKKRQAAVDLAETARLADTPENAGYATESDKIMAEGDIAFGDTRIGTGTGDYDEYSDTPTGPVGSQFGDPTYADPGVDAEENQPEPTYTAPPAYQGSPAYSGSDSGGSYDGADSMSDYSSDPTGYSGSFAVGGIVRLRKNKQNSRIHDRRKRLAMGGIASLHG